MVGGTFSSTELSFSVARRKEIMRLEMRTEPDAPAADDARGAEDDDVDEEVELRQEGGTGLALNAKVSSLGGGPS